MMKEKKTKTKLEVAPPGFEPAPQLPSVREANLIQLGHANTTLINFKN